MKTPNAIIKTTVAPATAAPRIVYNTARLRKPSPLPLRPLVPNRFKPPKGEKEIYLYVSAHTYKHTHTHTHTQTLSLSMHLLPLKKKRQQ